MHRNLRKLLLWSRKTKWRTKNGISASDTDRDTRAHAGGIF